MASRFFRLVLSALILAAGTTLAEAHTGVGSTAGFMHGFGHPLGGLDHILAMVAVGLFAARLGGKALWLVPGAFVGMMAAGGILGIMGVNVPLVELGIAASVIVLGAAVALQLKVSTVLAMGLVGFFAIFHGHAHGAEMPVETSGLAYAAGFMLATALLHVAGIGLGLGIGRLAQPQTSGVSRLAGGAMTLAGVGILTGYL